MFAYKNFHYLKTIDKAAQEAALNEVEQSGLWLHNQTRQHNIRVQAETNAIILRNYVAPPRHTENGWDIQESRDVLMDHFPVVGSLIRQFAQEQNTSLARSMIVRLQPWGQVYKHLDYGKYYQRDRFHLVLQSESSVMTSGDEACTMRERELWWFNNSLEHQSFNHSDSWRIHVIFDLESNRFKARV